MLIRRMIDSIRAQNWSALLSELVIVVVGIFLAIQVDSWWQERGDVKQEQEYIARLTQDVEKDVVSIRFSISLAEYRLSLADLLILVATDPLVAREQPVDFMTAIHQSSFTHTPSLNTDTFEELRATGGLRLLRDDALKAALFEYHRYDKMMLQYQSLQLMTEFRHFELASGVLSNEQYVWMQDELGYVSPNTRPDVSFSETQLDGLEEAAKRIAATPEFVAWLPESRSMQIELIGTHNSRLERAETLLDTLRNHD